MTGSETEAEAARPSLPRRIFERVDWRINPVLLRDLRLYMRGRMMLASYFLVLGSLIMLGISYAIYARFEGSDGRRLLYFLCMILAVICGAMIPNMLFERFRSELANRATELALTSPLTPARLVRGKLLGAWCMVLMVVSAAAPMAATAYLLGGVNLVSIFGMMGGVLVAGFTVPVLQMHIAADHRGGKDSSRAIAAMLFVGELIMMVAYAAFLDDIFLSTGYRYRGPFNRMLLASLIIAAVLVAQFLYFVTVGVLRGEAENRDILPRLSLSFAAYAGGLCAYGVYIYSGRGAFFGVANDWEALLTVCCIVSYAFCAGFTAVTNSSPTTPRNLREHWKTHTFRGLFLLPGTGSLCAYFLVNAAVILSPVLLAVAFTASIDEDVWMYLCVAMAPFMAIAYGVVCYRFAVLPLVKDKRNPKHLSHTITIVNVVLALFSIFFMVVVGHLWEGSDLYRFILGSTPVGLVSAAVIESGSYAPDAGGVGLLLMIPLFAILIGIAARSRREPDGGIGGKKDKDQECAETN